MPLALVQALSEHKAPKLITKARSLTQRVLRQIANGCHTITLEKKSAIRCFLCYLRASSCSNNGSSGLIIYLTAVSENGPRRHRLMDGKITSGVGWLGRKKKKKLLKTHRSQTLKGCCSRSPSSSQMDDWRVWAVYEFDGVRGEREREREREKARRKWKPTDHAWKLFGEGLRRKILFFTSFRFRQKSSVCWKFDFFQKFHFWLSNHRQGSRRKPQGSYFSVNSSEFKYLPYK